MLLQGTYAMLQPEDQKPAEQWGFLGLLIRFSRIGIFIALDWFQLLKAETRGCSQIATHAIFLLYCCNSLCCYVD